MIAANDIRIVDRYSRVAPFGVRFWDPITNTTVRDPLSVVVSAIDDPRVQVRAVGNSSGVYVVHRFPGLGNALRGAGDEAYWSQPLPRRRVRVEVTDPAGAYQPISFEAQIPFRGVFALSCAPLSPPGSVSAIPLYSAPTRPIPNGRAVIRAELKPLAANTSAAWAMVTAEFLGTVVAHGVADSQGRIILIFSYPEPARRPIASPPSSPPAPAAGPITWDIDLRVFHSPALSTSAIPDYCSVLQQPEARLLSSRSPPTDFAQVAVVLGNETFAATAGESCLYVVPI